MATSSGADISGFADIEREQWVGGGIYRAYQKTTRRVVGYLRYIVALNGEGVIKINTTYTHPDWRGKRVATALGERLHLDHPNHSLDLGTPNLDDLPARGFWEHQRNIQPDWGTAVVQAQV